MSRAEAKRQISEYMPSIGIECHVQLKTKSKLFSSVSNDATNAAPNTLISHIDIGLPGALPVLNQEAVKLAVKAALVFNTRPQKFSKFDRKHYFYPDLPKGYQISQYDQPIIKGGHVNITVEGKTQLVRLNRIHLEEDAGKNTHPAGADFSLVDLNRAGTPLFEIVSEPDLHSAEAAKAYARELYLLVRYADLSDADLFHGNMRFDVNVSISRDPQKLGTRSEVKNLNSFRSVASAVDYEIHRQIELIESGQRVVQETRGWDEAKQKTVSQRSKEEAHDYRYMPEPDIPPIVLDEAMIKAAAASLPILPDELRQRLADLKLDHSTVETLVEEIPAGQFMANLIDLVDKAAARHIANWLTGVVQAMIADKKLRWSAAHLKIDNFKKLADMLAQNQISTTAAKQIVAIMVKDGRAPGAIAKKLNLKQVSSEAELEKLINQVISAHQAAATDVKKGQAKAIGFLVGQVMQASQGKANPQKVQELIKKILK